MSKLGKNVVSQHMSWTFLPPFYCAWFSITENDIRLIRKLWFITFNNYPGLSLYSCLKWWSQWWFDPVAISLDIGNFWQQLSNGWLSLIYNLAFRGFIHILTIAGLFGNLDNIIHILLEKQEWDCFAKFENQNTADAQGGDQQQHLLTNRQEWERFQCGCTWNWYIIDPYTTENIIIHTLNNPRRECWKSFTLSG